MTRRPVPPNLPWFRSRARLVKVPGLSLPYQLKISFTRGVFISVASNIQAVLIVPCSRLLKSRRKFTWGCRGSPTARLPYAAQNTSTIRSRKEIWKGAESSQDFEPDGHDEPSVSNGAHYSV